jgi:ABC-type lipopolysaccharide export system ATPase subunit
MPHRIISMQKLGHGVSLSVLSQVVVGLYSPLGGFGKVQCFSRWACWVGKNGKCGEDVSRWQRI